MKLSSFLNLIESNLDFVEDKSNNGLQVGKEKDIQKVGFAVDANIETFKKAVENKCDLLVVHHGISWDDSLKKITGNNFQRVEYLIEHDLALAAYHLPLDYNENIGNNAQLASMLGLRKTKQVRGGFYGELRRDLNIEELKTALDKSLSTNSKLHKFGKDLIHSIFVSSGTGSRKIETSKIADCFITGDLKYGDIQIIKEIKQNVIEAGHYETETIGLKALMKLISRKADAEMVFIRK